MARSWFRRSLRRRVLVHTVDGRSVRGILRHVYPGELVLAHAEYLHAAGPEELVGEICVPRERVSFCQLLPPEEP